MCYNGSILEIYGQRAVREEDCRRACRLTMSCWGFNMEWLGHVDAVGYCELVDTTVHTGLINDTTRSFFGTCISFVCEVRSSVFIK
jgi:hypothetical protein